MYRNLLAPRYALLLCLLLLVGCSTRIIYYWLDTFMVWQLNDYFSLTTPQKRELNHEIRSLMTWHRQHEIPAYASDLTALAKAVASPMDPALITLHLNNLQQHLGRTLHHAIPGTVRLTRTLTDQQLNHFMTDRLTRQQAHRDSFTNDLKAQRIATFAEKMNKRLIYWLGDVKPAQAPLVNQWAAWQYELMAPWLEYQQTWLTELELLLKQRHDPQFTDTLVTLLEKSNGLMDGRFTGYSEQSRQYTINWLSQLSYSLDLSQRAHLMKRLNGYAADFTKMNRK